MRHNIEIITLKCFNGVYRRISCLYLDEPLRVQIERYESPSHHHTS